MGERIKGREYPFPHAYQYNMPERAARDNKTCADFLDDGTGWSSMMEKQIGLVKKRMAK